MDCLHCGKKLSMVKKLTTGEFCSAAHKKAYLQEQEKFALARLLENQNRLGGGAPAPVKKDLDQVAREAAQAKAAKRNARGKPRRDSGDATLNAPVEGDYLLEPVKPSVGPKYLALPEAHAELQVAPMLPEFEAGVDGARSNAAQSDLQPALQPVLQPALQPDERPFFSVSNRFGLDAILSLAEQQEPHAEFVAIPEFAANVAPQELYECGSGASLSWLNAVCRPQAKGQLTGDWLEIPARREGEAWESAVDYLGAQELDAGNGFALDGAVVAARASDGVSLEPFGAKRFAFSRLPEVAAPSFARELLELAAAVEWDAVVGSELATDVVGHRGAVDFEPNAVVLLAGSGERAWRKPGSIHEVAAAAEWAPARPKQASFAAALRGAAGQMGSDYGYFSLPLTTGAKFDETLLRFESDGLGVVYRAEGQLARTPRGPYDLSLGNRYFPPPPRIASVPRVVNPAAHPALETRLVALEIPAGAGAASQARLRAHGELGLSRGSVFLPKIKHKIRPVVLDDSFYAALGQLTEGNRDFSIAGLKKHWNRAPADLRWVAVAIPLVLGLIWYSSSGDGGTLDAPEDAGVAASAPAKADAPPLRTAGATGKPGSAAVASAGSGAIHPGGNAPAAEETTASEPGLVSRIFGDDSMVTVKRSIQKRAAVELSDDFRQGLGDWSGVGDWASGWSYDRAGFLRPRQIAFYTPTLELTDYRFEFLGQIERKALSWVFRAADARNYYVNRLEIAGAAPLPDVVLVRYAVIGGKAGPRTVTRLPMQVQMDTVYRIRVDVQGNNFVTTVQGQVVDVFSDDRITRGGVGFFAAPGEDVRLRWVEVTHQYDFLGRLCAFLVPYNVSK
jgi:hypothetical protein